jgi:cytochrome b
MEHKTGWDTPTRIMHWMTASLVIALFLSAVGLEILEETFGKVAQIKLKYVHLYLGLALTASVSARILWGFFGNSSVNWRGISSGVAKYPGLVAAELDFVLRGVDSDKRKKEGHNPLAIPVYFLALAMILLQISTGLGMWDGLDQKAKKHGVAQALTKPSMAALSKPMDLLVPSAFADDNDDDEKGNASRGGEAGGESKKEEGIGEEIHEIGLLWVPFFLLLHLGGMFIHYLRGERGFLRGMTTGE